MNSEALGGDYNQGDKEWEHLNAQDELNAEYGDELKGIDTELEAKAANDRAEAQKVGQQAAEAVAAEPQVTKIPAVDPEKVRADAALEQDLVDINAIPDASAATEQWQDEQNNVDAALTDRKAQRAADGQLEKEYNDIEGKKDDLTPGDIAGTGEAAGQQAA